MSDLISTLNTQNHPTLQLMHVSTKSWVMLKDGHAPMRCTWRPQSTAASSSEEHAPLKLTPKEDMCII